MQFFVPLFALGGAVYMLLCAYLFFMQSRMLYYPNLPSRKLRTTPAAIGLDYEPVTLTADDRVRLHGWFVPAEKQRAVLLFFHGNAGNISHRLDSLRIFHELGLSVLIFDYRGYGQSEGRPSEQGTYLDAEAAWRHLTVDRGIHPGNIVLFGRSLGGAVAAHQAAMDTPAGLILESVFTSVPDLAASYYRFIPVRLLSRFRYDTLAAVRMASCPVLIIHSPNDDIISYENGQRLYEAAEEPKTFLAIRGSHNEGFLASGSLYMNGLDVFIASLPYQKPEDK